MQTQHLATTNTSQESKNFEEIKKIWSDHFGVQTKIEKKEFVKVALENIDKNKKYHRGLVEENLCKFYEIYEIFSGNKNQMNFQQFQHAFLFLKQNNSKNEKNNTNLASAIELIHQNLSSITQCKLFDITQGDPSQPDISKTLFAESVYVLTLSHPQTEIPESDKFCMGLNLILNVKRNDSIFKRSLISKTPITIKDPTSGSLSTLAYFIDFNNEPLGDLSFLTELVNGIVSTGSPFNQKKSSTTRTSYQKRNNDGIDVTLSQAPTSIWEKLTTENEQKLTASNPLKVNVVL